MMEPRLKHFGWGREGEGLTPAEEAFVLQRFEQRFGPPADDEIKPPRLEDIKLETPRLDPPASYRSVRPRSMTARHIPTANHSPITCGGWSATIAARRTSSPIRTMKRRSRQRSI